MLISEARVISSHLDYRPRRNLSATLYLIILQWNKVVKIILKFRLTRLNNTIRLSLSLFNSLCILLHSRLAKIPNFTSYHSCLLFCNQWTTAINYWVNYDHIMFMYIKSLNLHRNHTVSILVRQASPMRYMWM